MFEGETSKIEGLLKMVEVGEAKGGVANDLVVV